MHVPFEEKEIVPQLLQVLIFDLKELKTMTPIINKKRGIRNNKSKILPRKLIKKFIPKIETSVIITNEYVKKFLLALRK